LRHIYFSHTPADVGCLTGLRTLPFFEVGKDKGYEIQELGSLKELGGGLKIVNLVHVRDKEEAKGADLFGKSKINTLVMDGVQKEKAVAPASTTRMCWKASSLTQTYEA